MEALLCYWQTNKPHSSLHNSSSLFGRFKLLLVWYWLLNIQSWSWYLCTYFQTFHTSPVLLSDPRLIFSASNLWGRIWSKKSRLEKETTYLAVTHKLVPNSSQNCVSTKSYTDARVNQTATSTSYPFQACYDWAVKEPHWCWMSVFTLVIYPVTYRSCK
jgi:hypothetical protein